MRNKLLIIFLLCGMAGEAQVKGMLEQIYYCNSAGEFSMAAVGQVQNKKNWVTQVRYNYEEARTASFYIGRLYERHGNLAYSFIPMAGGVVGKFNGLSIGINMHLEYHNFYFASQSQYTYSVGEEADNFYFSWSELGYQPSKWFYGGTALQETYFPQHGSYLTHPGLVIGFSYKNWTLPIYAFRTGKSTADFICSIIYEW